MDILIEKLLFWTELESSSCTKSNFDLSKRIVEIMEKYTLILKENDINCSVHFDASEECLVSVDKEGIDVVLDNLVTNAIKYSNGKRIDITSTGVADSVKFTIANGVGGMEKIIWIVCGDLIMY